MRPVRNTLIKGRRKEAFSPYAEASGCSTQARSVKSQIYGVGKPAAACADRSVSAPALPVRIGADAASAGLVPQIAHVSAAGCPPLITWGFT
ncbi:hypothetical protein D3C72_1600680 [compost metagenome]